MLRFMHNEMTQKQLGDAIGVTRQTIMAIESNKYSASLEVAYKIVEVFNVPFEDVFQYVAIDE
jgi:putative transcriptional regulator